MKKDRATQARYRLSTKGRFTDSKAEASRRGVVWHLTFEEFKTLLDALHCHYCGTFALPHTKSGLDRKDAAQGYSVANVVRCCYTCNTAKKKMHHDIFCRICVKPLDTELHNNTGL